MSTFILKFILCSGVLYGAYHFILKNEKTLRFNRFFLLSILGFSLLFPLVVTKTKVVELAPITVDYSIYDTAPSEAVYESTQMNTPTEAPVTIKLTDVLWGMYVLVSVIFLFRFITNLVQLSLIKSKGTLVTKNGLDFCLRDDIHSSFTFLGTIFTNKTNFEKGELPEEIIQHEAVHANQRHSIDIIAIELIQCVLWFNPLLYLIKSAIKLNHEFLADEQVCAESGEISKYQKTLIQYVYNSKQQPVLASQLTYGQTKNRLNMMVKNFQMRSAALRILVTLAITSTALWGFGETKVVAQSVSDDYPNTEASAQEQKPPLKYITVNTPLSNQKVRFILANGQMKEAVYSDLTEEEKKRFDQPEAKGEYYIEPVKVNRPTSEQLNDFLNEKEFGVWLDNKRINNSELTKYQSNDFHHYYVSKLYPNAKNYGQHKYQVNLTTTSAYEQEPFANGGWRDWGLVKEERARWLLKQSQNTPSPPPRRVRINDRTMVKFKYANGDEVKGRFGQLNERQLKLFMSPEGEGMVFLPPPPPAAITQEMLEQYADPKYSVTIDNNEIDAKDLLNYKPEDFYLYIKKLEIQSDGQGSKVTGIKFLTKKNFDTSGKWIPFKKEFLPEEQKNTPPPPKPESGNKGGSVTGPDSFKAFSINVTDIDGSVISMECTGCAWKTLSFGSTFNSDYTVDYYGVTKSSRYRLRDAQFAFSVDKGRSSVAIKSLRGTAWDKIDLDIRSFRKATISDKQITSDQQANSDFYGLVKSETLLRFTNNAGTRVEKRYAALTNSEKEELLSEKADTEIFMVFGKTDPMSQKDWDALQDTEKYGIWLNGDQIKNSDLKDYEANDIYKYSLRKMHPSMSNLGDFEIWYFAHTKEWVKDNNELIGEDYGNWLSFREAYNLNKEVAERSAKN